MARQDGETPRSAKPLRMWPGLALVGLQWLTRFGVPALFPEALEKAILGSLALGVAVVVWWAFFSRAARLERWGGSLLLIAALAFTPAILHESVATGGMGMLFFIYAVPVSCLALVAAAWASQRLAAGPRRATLAAAILFSCLGWGLLRTEGITADVSSSFAWRWSATPEERLLAETRGSLPGAPAEREPEGGFVTPEPRAAEPEPAVDPAAAAESAAAPLAESATEPPAESAAEPPAETATEPPAESAAVAPPPPRAAAAEPAWPGFRGAGRDGDVPGVRIATDWKAAPPAELWRRPVGPGWSSFAVAGERIYTQEQRGELEVVACYDRTSGEPVWQHGDAARFWESNAGAGPRATPTVSGGRVYALGATGILNALEAADGAPVWSRDVAAEAGKEVPDWGFSASPLVVGEVVVVAAGGALLGYDAATGDPRWRGPDGGQGYSSPHLATIDGIPQVLFASHAGLAGVAPGDGTVLWEHAWPGFPIVQPAVIGGGDLLVAVTADSGLRRLSVSRADGGWRVEERWTSIRLKPYFNDFVVHGGHAYGFDGGILACVEVETGNRCWKGGRYGHGQLILLPDQELLLVLSEQGELALVRAAPDGFAELARLPALSGKTWNHPVLVGDLLLVRNDREMVAYRLAPEGG